MNLRKLIVLVSRVILGAVFVYASLDKVAHPLAFSRAVSNYHLLPWGLENLMAVILPWVELLIGLGLIFGLFLDGASLTAQTLLIVFMLAVATALIRGFNIECGCGLKPGEMVGIGKIIEDIIYFCLSWIVYKCKDSRIFVFMK